MTYSRVLPIPETQTALVVGATTKHDDETDNDQTHDCDEFDGRKPELGFTEDSDCDDVQKQDNDEEDGNPDGIMDRRLPVFQQDGSGSGFSSDQNGVCVPIIPPRRKRKGRIHKAFDKVRDGNALHGQVSDDFCQVVHDIPDDDHHGQVSHEQRGGTDQGKDSTGSHEETCSDSTAEGPANASVTSPSELH